MNALLFHAENKGSLGLPRWILFLMITMFGLPAVVLPLFTWHELGQNPLLVILYIVAWFPLGVMYFLKRLMTRYGLRVYQDGQVEIVYPFSIQRWNVHQMSEVQHKRHFVGATHSYRTWIHFFDLEGKHLCSLSPMAFQAEDLATFTSQLKLLNPKLVIASA